MTFFVFWTKPLFNIHLMQKIMSDYMMTIKTFDGNNDQIPAVVQNEA